MFKSIRTILCGATLAAGLTGFVFAAQVRADDPPNMQDYNTYWQVAENPNPPDPSLDYNTYWAEVQAKQQAQDRQ